MTLDVFPLSDWYAVFDMFEGGEIEEVHLLDWLRGHLKEAKERVRLLIVEERCLIVDAEIASFRKTNVPLMKWLYPALYANKLIDVQPMLVPTGLKYYMHQRAKQHLKTLPFQEAIRNILGGYDTFHSTILGREEASKALSDEIMRDLEGIRRRVLC